MDLSLPAYTCPNRTVDRVLELLHDTIDKKPPFETYRMNYGQLATLGIEKGKPFAPDQRMTVILERAAEVANAQMRMVSFADRLENVPLP